MEGKYPRLLERYATRAPRSRHRIFQNVFRLRSGRGCEICPANDVGEGAGQGAAEGVGTPAAKGAMSFRGRSATRKSPNSSSRIAEYMTNNPTAPSMMT